MPVFKQLKDSPSALIEWVGGPERKASSMTTAPVSLLKEYKLEQQGVFVQDIWTDRSLLYKQHHSKQWTLQFSTHKKDIQMCITASHNSISVRLVKPNHSLGCIAVPLNYLHRCTMSRIDKFNMTGDWNTKDIVLYEPRDGPRLFNCSQTSLGHPLCYVSWL